jgi:hypothetical protein
VDGRVGKDVTTVTPTDTDAPDYSIRFFMGELHWRSRETKHEPKSADKGFGI